MNARTSHIALAIVLSLATPLVGCGTSPMPTEDDLARDAIEQEREEDVVLTDDDVELSDPDAEPFEDEFAEGETEEPAASDATQHVGSDEVGYVDLPATWVEFKDVDGNDSIQWCDGTPYTIITMDLFNMDSVPADQRANYTTEDAANAVWDNILADGVAEEDVQGARVALAGTEAIQVYAYYPDGTYLVCYLVEDDAGVIHYISVEGPSSTIMEAVQIVEDTYTM